MLFTQQAQGGNAFADCWRMLQTELAVDRRRAVGISSARHAALKFQARPLRPLTSSYFVRAGLLFRRWLSALTSRPADSLISPAMPCSERGL